MTDIVVTWPKSQRFGVYLLELERAKSRGLQINYRIPKHTRPELDDSDDHRLYRVHDGRVRGWTPLVAVEYREPFAVSRVPSDPMYHAPGARYWPPGLYLVCEPEWHELDHWPHMKGFRGWRHINRPT